MSAFVTIIALIVFGVTLALGAILLFATVLLLWRAIASVGWPMALGRIVAPNDESEDSRSAAVKSDAPFTATGFSFEAKVAYEYTVEGKRYVSSSIRAGDFSSTNPNRAMRLAAKYPAGTPVTVHYNPSNPEDAVLEPGLPKVLFGVLASIACTIFALGLSGILVNVGLMTVDLELIAFGIASLAGIFLGGLVSIAAARGIIMGWSSRDWSQTGGKVAIAYVRAIKNPRRFGIIYAANVAYQYTAQGTDYASSNISYKSVEFEDGRKIVERYPEGKGVSVYYDPRHPQRAVLEPGLHWSGILLMLMGLAFFIFGMGMLVIGFWF